MLDDMINVDADTASGFSALGAALWIGVLILCGWYGIFILQAIAAIFMWMTFAAYLHQNRTTLSDLIFGVIVSLIPAISVVVALASITYWTDKFKDIEIGGGKQ